MALPPEKTPIVAPRQKPIDDDVMSLVRGEKIVQDAPKDTLGIIGEVARQSGQNPDKFQRQLLSYIQQTGAKLLQIGNSVFLLTPVEPGVVESHILTVGGAKEMAQSYVNLAKQLKGMGVSVLRTYTDNPAHTAVAKMTKLPITTRQESRMVGNEMKPVYVFELEL
jgi:hypothetical protein